MINDPSNKTPRNLIGFVGHLFFRCSRRLTDIIHLLPDRVIFSKEEGRILQSVVYNINGYRIKWMIPYVYFSLINAVLIDGFGTFQMGTILSFGIPEILNRMPNLVN
jgi:hypothetical protein